jgi:hypothetical protein
MEILSKSRIEKFRACPRRYQFEYVDGRVPVGKARPLKLGIAWHGAMEVYWRDGREPAIQWLIDQAEGLDEIDTARLVALLRHYSPPVELYDVVSIEESFEGAIRVPGRARSLRGMRYGGRIDGLLRRRDTGALWLLEHKTTSDQIAGWGEFWQRLNLDAQTSWYLLYARRAEGVLYDVVRKPLLRPSKADDVWAATQKVAVTDAFLERVSKEIAANPGEFYQCREIRKTPDDLDEAAADLADYAVSIRRCRRAGRFPRNTDSCRGLYGACPYIEVCSGAARLEDSTLFEDRPLP